MMPDDYSDYRRSYSRGLLSRAEWHDLRWGIYTGFALAVCVFTAFVIVMTMT
jgi:hypothetical protein